MTKQLISAISKDDVPTFRAFLRSDPKALQALVYGSLPLLIHLVRKGRTEMVKLFLLHGGDVNVKDHNGRTPLHHLAGVRPKNEVTIADLLMSFGADPRIKEHNGATPIELCRYGAFAVAKVLLGGSSEGAPDPRVFSVGGTLLPAPADRVMRELSGDLDRLAEANPYAEKPHVSVDFVAKEFHSGRTWQGARYAGYSKTEMHMNFQALVSPGMTREEAWDYLLEVCAQASAEAADRYQKKGLHFDADGMAKVLAQIWDQRLQPKGKRGKA